MSPRPKSPPSIALARHWEEYLYSLVTDSEWVNRRIETREIRDLNVVERRISLDLNVNRLQQLSEDLPTIWHGRVPIIIGFVKRQLVPNLDLRDQSGDTLPLLTSDDAAATWCNLLMKVAKECVAKHPQRCAGLVVTDQFADEVFRTIRPFRACDELGFKPDIAAAGTESGGKESPYVDFVS
jgi:hypothetical protein